MIRGNFTAHSPLGELKLYRLPLLITIVHNNIGILKLVEEFKYTYESLYPDNLKISKKLIKQKIHEITTMQSKKLIVSEEFLKQYKPDLLLPPTIT
ncbi:hypothetical protein HZS_1770 [Henneguya salminicola]|nr:hypothetical protein HZS_1770 [Henneguya salminicola]